MGRIAGIDYGEKRIGLAFSDESQTIATPHSVIENGAEALKHLARLVYERNAEAVVLGKSHTYRGEDNPVMEGVRRFKEKLEREIGIPVYFESEALTSAQAARHEVHRELRDASAAALILQTYLDKKRAAPDRSS